MGLVILIAFVLALLLAPVFGVDSRVDDRRGWWPGRRSSTLPR
jgi:hypothetical protein